MTMENLSSFLMNQKRQTLKFDLIYFCCLPRGSHALLSCSSRKLSLTKYCIDQTNGNPSVEILVSTSTCESSNWGMKTVFPWAVKAKQLPKFPLQVYTNELSSARSFYIPHESTTKKKPKVFLSEVLLVNAGEMLISWQLKL